MNSKFKRTKTFLTFLYMDRSGAQKVGRVPRGLRRHLQDEYCLPQAGMASPVPGDRLCVHHTTPSPLGWAEPSPVLDVPGSGSCAGDMQREEVTGKGTPLGAPHPSRDKGQRTHLFFLDSHLSRASRGLPWIDLGTERSQGEGLQAESS